MAFLPFVVLADNLTELLNEMIDRQVERNLKDQRSVIP